MGKVGPDSVGSMITVGIKTNKPVFYEGGRKAEGSGPQGSQAVRWCSDGRRGEYRVLNGIEALAYEGP